MIPYREVIDTLRQQDQKWLAVLGNGDPPEYLYDAVLVATLSAAIPPLVAMRTAKRSMLKDYELTENYSKLATLPEQETADLAKLIHEIVTRRNPKN